MIVSNINLSLIFVCIEEICIVNLMLSVQNYLLNLCVRIVNLQSYIFVEKLVLTICSKAYYMQKLYIFIEHFNLKQECAQ